MSKCNECISSNQDNEELEIPLEIQNDNESISNDEINESTDSNELIENGSFESFSGDFESVEGFDPSYALNEGLLNESFQINEEINNLPTAGTVEYSDELAESVCGRDGRIRINPTTKFPFRANCQLIITMANGRKARCSGWFIGPRTVMTSGHCVYSHTAGGWAREIEVIPGMNGSSKPYGSQVSKSFKSVRGWVKNKNSNHDYGCIILPNKTLGNKVGWYGFASYKKATLKHLTVNNAGYPGDKTFGTQWYNGGKVTKVTSKKIEYMIDTNGGQSGSPVWQLKNKTQRYAVGIHGYGGCPNKAVRITKSVFDNMLKWKNI